MPPIEEGAIRVKKVEVKRDLIKNTIRKSKQNLVDALGTVFLPQIAENKTKLIEEYLQKLSDELNEKIKSFKSDDSNYDLLEAFEEKAGDFNKKEQEIKEALPALEESSHKVREMIPQWQEAIANGKINETFVNNMYDALAQPSQKLQDVFTKIAELERLVPKSIYFNSEAEKFYNSIFTGAERTLNQYTAGWKESNLDSVSSFESAVKELEALEEKQRLPDDPAGEEVSTATPENTTKNEEKSGNSSFASRVLRSLGGAREKGNQIQ
jgi:DNA repair exonuclease SbcCD ATPase subunit